MSVTRTGTVGDADAARTVMTTLLAKARAIGAASIQIPSTSQEPS